MTDGVIILHGIFRTKSSMRKIEKFLSIKGYQTLNVDYKSTKRSLEEIIEDIQPEIDSFVQNISGQVHFVGYSMGGLVVRAYLHKFRPKNLGRVVMLGTPNQGSPIANLLQSLFLYRRFYGPAGQQLITDQKAFAHIFGPVDYELGVLAGNKTLDPISSYIIGGVNDGKVSVESTKLQGMKDHIVVPATHILFPTNKQAHKRILEFLTTGSFKR